MSETPENAVIDAKVVEAPPAPPPPAATAAAPPSEDVEEEGSEIVDVWKELYDESEKQIGRTGSKQFLENMQKGFAVQTAREFRMNTYELIKKIVAIGGETAIELERLGADFEDLKDEVIKHTRLFNDLMSTSIIAHALNLSRLCLERVQDQEIRTLAQAIYNSMHPSTTDAVANGVKPPVVQP